MAEEGAPTGERRSLVAGVDIGGTKVAFAIADGAGRLLLQRRRPTEPSGSAARDLARMADDLRALLAELGATPSALAAVGVSVPGPMDPEAGVLLRPPNLPGWQRAPVRAALEAALGCPVAIENDANAAALAEWRFGAGRGHRDLVYLTMSTGVGGGLVLDGRLHRGARAGAGEVGHVAVEWPGETCGCGLRGCLEAYVGGRAWTQRLQRATPADSLVARLAGGAALARPEHVVEAARAGCAFALSELDRFNEYLARGIAALAFTLDPALVVLGTICVAAGEDLCFAPLRAKLRARLWPEFADHLAIAPDALGDELPARAGVGVALHALEAARA
ncbi:MAG: ROK family protein [Myxococcales bacterium]|nr:ROK family protein [Myxococcales bacterium]